MNGDCTACWLDWDDKEIDVTDGDDVARVEPASDAGNAIAAAPAGEFDGGSEPLPNISRLGSRRLSGKVPRPGTVSKGDLAAAGEATESRDADADAAGPARAGRADVGLVGPPSRYDSDWVSCGSSGELFFWTMLQSKVHELARGCSTQVSSNARQTAGRCAVRIAMLPCCHAVLQDGGKY